MPIICDLLESVRSGSDFDNTDRVVMACAYATHNLLGRLCDESVYEADLAARLRAAGVAQVDTQVAVTASYRGFSKTYRLDLVVNGFVYELKTVAFLPPVHDAQVYHDAALMDTDRIKLLNFGAHRVEGLLRRSPFETVDRRKVNIDRNRWQPLSDGCLNLAEDAEGCFRDWGGFLDARLFEEALAFFRGGESQCLQKLPVTRNSLHLGYHKVLMHSDRIGFLVTSLSDDVSFHEKHLRSLLSVLPLRAWQWINIHHATMRMVTLMSPNLANIS